MNVHAETELLAARGVQLVLHSLVVHLLDVLVSEHQHEDEGQGEGQQSQRQLKAAVRDVDAGANDHGGQVGGRCDHAQNAAHRQDGSGLQCGHAHHHQHGGHDGAGAQHGSGGGTGDHSGEHHDDHDEAQHQGGQLVELLDDDRGHSVQSAGSLDDLHEDHGGGDDQDGVHIGEHAFNEMTQCIHKRQIQAANEAANDHAADGRKNHRQADRQLAGEASNQEHTEHDDEGNKFNAH